MSKNIDFKVKLLTWHYAIKWPFISLLLFYLQVLLRFEVHIQYNKGIFFHQATCLKYKDLVQKG